MELYKKIRKLRKERGLTQPQLANELGIALSTIRNYESPKVSRIPHTDIIKIIADFFDVPSEYLLKDDCINEEYNNIDIGKTLSLSDVSIKKIKNINSNTKNNVIDNFISNISENDFWKKLDECSNLQKELKELQPIKEIEKYKNNFKKYISNKNIFDYSQDDICSVFLEIDQEKYYKENTCTYKKEDKEIILNCINIIKNNTLLGEKDEENTPYFYYKYDFCTITIENCINNNAKIPLEDIKNFFNIPTREFKERTDRLEILGFYISNELVRYIKNI